MRQTHKFKELKDVEAVVAKASSLSAAAKALGVDRSTLHRWMEAGKIARPRSMPPPANPDDPKFAAPADAASWAEGVTRAYALSATDRELVALAEEALRLAKKPDEAIRSRLAAMAEYRQLVRQLNLDAATPAQTQPATVPARSPVRRGGGDPRALLMAVK